MNTRVEEFDAYAAGLPSVGMVVSSWRQHDHARGGRDLLHTLEAPERYCRRHVVEVLLVARAWVQRYPKAKETERLKKILEALEPRR